VSQLRRFRGNAFGLVWGICTPMAAQNRRSASLHIILIGSVE